MMQPPVKPAPAPAPAPALPVTARRRSAPGARLARSWQLYLLLLPTLLLVLLFQYVPMYGVTIAFKNFKPYLGVLGSEWVGLRHFIRFVESPSFWRLIQNTVLLSGYELLLGFPIPIILALMMNVVTGRRFKRTVQMVTYAPHFISTVVIVGMLGVFLSKNFGLANHLLAALGGERIFFLGRAAWFRSLYVFSEVWQNAGWGTIIYLAALSVIDPEQHEAAVVDGATLWQRVWHIDIPGIMPTIVILLILNVGRIMNLGFEKAFLMQNALNLQVSEIIPTYVYKVGLIDARYSFSAAVDLFRTVINFTLLVSVNRIAKLMGQSGLW